MCEKPILGSIYTTSLNFAPTGYAFCNGQLLPINQNTALFSILGTTYGGNGTTTFALPNLRERVPVGFNSSVGELNTVKMTQSGDAQMTSSIIVKLDN